MDWSKAKNILIVAFIITNIFLIYHIQKDMFDKGELQLISDAYIENVETYLKDRGVKLDIDIPREIVSLPSLMVRYRAFEPKEIAEKFLGENYEALENNVFISGEKKVESISNKKFIYRNFAKESINYPLDEKEAIKISDRFLKQQDLLIEDLVLQQIYFGVIEDYGEVPLYKLVYNQNYKNMFLAESYIHVYIRHKEVVGVEAMLLEYEKTDGDRKRIIPATEALLRKMNDIIKESEGNHDIAITEMEIGYYFNTEDINFTTWDTIEAGTAFPSWKIVLSNGKTFYVEAL
ncbi:Two-component signal transduction system YycFG, regulatory protein YycI [Natronincola peptidivorans]|uniref:Two-component signal transduction system YycFG, regulatory protein YycI n=1 Tax=Natronincola peptidivorans TaxID=426128 RepID=A0A1I0B5V4_9FIRM|nr:two-component system regulatory protein YycI [Natronincola peptidivorans]SET01379.1 Two-component signal transduction system YycFG, regulatory protein YycI [Natronincola peptidivorans]